MNTNTVKTNNVSLYEEILFFVAMTCAAFCAVAMVSLNSYAVRPLMLHNGLDLAALNLKLAVGFMASAAVCLVQRAAANHIG